MRKCLGLLSSVLLLFLVLPPPGFAGPTETACVRSDRSPGREVCACAQALADRLLSPGDQRQAAKIIADPDLFQIIAKRKNVAAKAFIDRYKTWGELTQKNCR